jgi:predicted MFS family arabinose efflux permease
MPKQAFETFRILSILYGGTFAFMAGVATIILLGKGLDFATVGLYFALYSIVAIILEIPTGAFADAYGRKNAIVISFFLQVAFLSGFILLPGGPLFAATAIIVAAADSFMSGSAEAYAVDMLYERGKMDYTHKLLSSAKFWQSGIFLVGSVVGGFAATFAPVYAAALGLPFALGGLLYAWFGLRDDRKREDFETVERGIISKTVLSLSESVKNPAVGGIYLLSVLWGFGTFGFMVYWQPVMRDIAGWDTTMIGAFFTLISIAIIVGSKLSASLKADWRTVALLYLAMGALLAFASIIPVPLAVVAFLLAWEVLFGMYVPVEGAIINHNTASSIRATVISVKALFYRVGWVVLGGIISLVGLGDPRFMWLVGAVFILLGAVLAALASAYRVPGATSGTSRG